MFIFCVDRIPSKKKYNENEFEKKIRSWKVLIDWYILLESQRSLKGKVNLKELRRY